MRTFSNFYDLKSNDENPKVWAEKHAFLVALENFESLFALRVAVTLSRWAYPLHLKCQSRTENLGDVRPMVQILTEIIIADA